MKILNRPYRFLSPLSYPQARYSITWVLAILFHFHSFSQANKNVKPPSPVAAGANGRLVYTPDSLGNRIPDFSYAGYKAGEESIPDAPVRIYVPHIKGDATKEIQKAIDYVASLPPGKNGVRGAVLLRSGRYEIRGSLKIHASGVVLRGSGAGDKGTVLFANRKDRETLIRIAGKNDRQTAEAVAITDAYVPVNALEFSIAIPGNFKAGDRVIIHRPSVKRWIEDLGAAHFGGGITALGWKPGQRDLFLDRQIVSISGNRITIDAPITTALDTSYGGATISSYTWPGRISQAGVENLSCESSYDRSNPKDEEHAWMAITMENVMDGWIRQVNFRHFAGSAVAIFETAKRITVEDCKSLAPVSEIGGQRRYSFFTSGQQTLFQRCYAENGYHDFSVGFCAPGPNAFVQCESRLPYSFSGTIDSWASGVLFDIVNVDGHALSYRNRGQDGQGAGWTAANSMFWQCAASKIDCYSPPGATNWAYGCWAQFDGNGYWESSNEQVRPRSFYYAQLADRLGSEVLKRAHLLKVETEASSSPPIDVANAMSKQAFQPAPLLRDWIDQAWQRQPMAVAYKDVKASTSLPWNVKMPGDQPAPFQLRNGWLLRGKAIAAGGRQDVPWWSGSSRPYAQKSTRAHITRFVPGRTGHGLTDDLDELTSSMVQNNTLALEHNYALWYDRRRDDHQRVRRMDGEVWPPFYEVPFARSGRETAWDGLSKYDLTKYNDWYWSRLKQFADLADEKGRLLVHQNYFQHNILEAGAHYADFAWRPVNNINNTGFPEPVLYAGDKRIFIAEQFYDIKNPVRRKIHRAYIRQCLDNFRDKSGVIQLIGAEFTGPLHFVQFWLDVIKEWEKETGKNALVGLSTTRDVQDSILADKERAAVVDIIDIRYWHYREDGSVYAPPGGQNLAPRQHARLVKPGRSSFEQVYRAVREYREKNPAKAVVYSSDSYDRLGWAAFMAGGSMPDLPHLSPAFLEAAVQMKPMDLPNKPAGQWCLGKPGWGYIIYTAADEIVQLDLAGVPGKFKATWIDPKTGKETRTENMAPGGKVKLHAGKDAAMVLWISKENSAL